MLDDKKSRSIEFIATPLGKVEISVATTGTASVTIAEMPRTLKNGMAIEHSTAAYVVVDPTSSGVQVKVSCMLIGSGLQGTSSTGEFLDCIEWFSDEWHLTIGTEDDEILEQRYKTLTFARNTIEYEDSGIVFELDIPTAKEPISLHVIVSAKKLPDERSNSTAWFFADIEHAEVKAAALRTA